jgi:chromosome segregation ATPase
MSLKSIFLLSILLLTFSVLTAQDSDDYVDVKETNENIARLERENDNHTATIAANNERKSYLENRISTSESRLVKIDENLEYASQTNVELNELNKETRDIETKERLEASRDELMSVMWILSTEQTRLAEQTADDKKEVDFLTRDSERRQTIIERNNAKIGPMKQAVANTESKISEITSKLDSIIGRLDGLREEVTSEQAP